MRILTTALVMAATTACGLANAADEIGPLDQRVWLRVSAFDPSISSGAQVDSSSGASGTAIDFERDLGLPKKKTLPTLLIGTRFRDAWRAEFEYFQLNRSGSQTLNQDIIFNGSTFLISTPATTRFASSVYRASVGYSFVKTPQDEFGVTAGAHVTHLDIVIDSQTLVAGAAVSTDHAEQDRTLPLPTLGLYGSHAFAPAWVASGQVNAFQVKSGGLDGHLFDMQANLLWRATPNIGLGLGYRYDDYKLTSTRDDFHGRVNYQFKGPQLFVEAAF